MNTLKIETVMKRMFCTLAALAMLIWTAPPARAEFKGELLREMDWLIHFDNSSTSGSTAMTVYYLGSRGVMDLNIFTVPGNSDDSQGRVEYAFSKPGRGVRRIIVEVDPPTEFLDIPVEISQTGRSLFATLHGSGRLVFNVVD
jgi:hypothetical protein